MPMIRHIWRLWCAGARVCACDKILCDGRASGMGYDMREIGAAMRRARQEKGMTVGELARKAGIGRATLYHYETGRNWPGLYSMLALADALGVALSDYVNHWAF